MAPRNLTRCAAMLILVGALFTSSPLTAQAWAGVEQFNTLGQLPADWEKSTFGIGTGVQNIWNVDDTPNFRKTVTGPITFTPYVSPQYCLNWNDGTGDAYPGNVSGPNIAGGVLTPVVDLTFAPNPELSYQHMWDIFSNTTRLRVRVWNETLTQLLKQETIIPSVQYQAWSPKVMTLQKEFGKVRVEFYYDGSAFANENDKSAGWFIDDVDFTGVNPPTVGITTASLASQTTNSNFNIQLDAQQGLPPYTWSFAAGTPVPPGLVISASGQLSGPITHSGSYRFRVRVVDSASPAGEAEKTFKLEVARQNPFPYSVASLPFADDFSNDKGWVWSEGSVNNAPSPGTFSEVGVGGWHRGTTHTNFPQNASDGGDPASDHSGTDDNMLMGVSVGGTIPTSVVINEWYYAYTPQIDIAGHQELDVKFKHLINAGPSNAQYQEYRVEMWRPQTSTWISVWVLPFNAGYGAKTQWTSESVSMNLQSPAASGATTRLRFGWRSKSTQAFASDKISSGWNLDDVLVTPKPLPNILKITELDILSPVNIGSTGAWPVTYFGQTYNVRLQVENTSSEVINVYDASFAGTAILGTAPYPTISPGLFTYSITPSQASPMVIPPGVHWVSYDPLNPPTGAGPEICHIDFTADNSNPTVVPPGTFVFLNLVLTGAEVAGAGRYTISNAKTDPSGEASLVLDVVPPLAINTAGMPRIAPNPPQLPDGSVGLFYSFTLSAVNGTPPYQNWSIINNPGFLNMNGASLEGTPPGPPATYTFEIRVEDSANPVASATQQFQLTILQAGATVPALKIVTASQLPNAIEITPYSPIAFNATGGTPPYQWSNFVWLPAPTGKGPLPTMTFDLLSGVFSGTPDPGTVGTYAFQVTCSDSTVPTKFDTGTFFISVLPINDVVIISTPTQVGTVGAPPVGFQTAPYNTGQPFKFEADGGYKGPAGEEYYWTVMQGQLPPGLALDSSSGELSGIPITGGQFVFTLRASDGAFPPASGTEQFEIFVNPLIPAPLAIATGANLPQGDENNWYQKFLTAANGKPPYIWQLQAGSTLPLGMYLNGTTGELFGVIEKSQAAAPNQDFTFTIEVADSAVIPETATKTFTLNVKAFEPGSLTITTDENLPEAGVFNDYSVFLRSTGGNSADPFDPYLYSMAVLTPLPNGLVLESNGQIHGAPKVEGTFTFIVECYDGSGDVTDKSFTLQINGVSNGAGDTTDVKPGKSRTVTVPFWEACSAGGSTGQAGLLLLAVLGACALWLRRREA